MGVHGGTWVSRTWVMHGEHMEVQPSIELKCVGACDHIRSEQGAG